MRNLKLSLLISLVFMASFAMIPIVKVNAISAETTGLVLWDADKNQGKYLHIGIYFMFASDKKLLIYDSTGNLSGTWDYPFTSTTLWDAGSVNIIGVNATHLIVASVYQTFESGQAKTRLDVWLLKATTLASTVLGAVIVSSNVNGLNRGDAVLVKSSDNNYYIVSSRRDDSASTAFVYRVFPTWGSIGSGGANLVLHKGSIVIPSSTESNTFYIISRNSMSGLRFQVYKVDVTTASFTAIGTSGIDNTWGDYTYYFGYGYHTDGTYHWYDVGVVYNNPSSTKTLYPQIVRFNDTYLTYVRSTVDDATSPVNILRAFTVPYSGAKVDADDLPYGPAHNYRFVYVSASYAFKQVNFNVKDLDTATPVCDIVSSPATYQAKSHYYSSATSVGGLQPPEWSVGIEYDYQNGKARADSFSAPNILFSYSYMISPTMSNLSGVLTGNVGIGYTYTGHVSASGYTSLSGTYQQFFYGNFSYTTTQWGFSEAFHGFGLWFGVSNVTTDTQGWILQRAGIITDGTFTYVFSASQAGYQDVLVLMDIQGVSYGVVHRFFWSSSGTTPVLPGPPGSTIVTPNLNYSTALALNFFIPLLLVCTPVFLLVPFLGMPGVFVGLLLGLSIGGITGLMPLWTVVLVAFVMFATLLFGRRHST